MDESKSRPCCHEETCPREEISRLTDPGGPMSARARFAACKIAETCGKLSTENLRYCFSKMFEAPPECQLCDEFLLAYKIERDAQLGKRDIEESRSSDE